MANFVMCVDRDGERRSRFVEAVRERVHLLPGLVGGKCESGAFACLWAASRHAPVSATSDERGAAVVWGRAFHDHVDRAVDAMGLTKAWETVPDRLPDPFDGYHAAVTFRADGATVLGADLLGIYPLYYWTDGSVFLAGSSAELFRHHPRFQVELDHEGLIGILLTMTTVGGRTLFKGVRRAAPGHLVVRTREGRVVEHEQYRIPLSDEHYGLPFSVLVDRLDEAMDDAVSRHISTAERHLTLVSGGLDSRTVVGYLARRGHRSVAVTFGAPHENEMRFAGQVARLSGLPHRGVDLSFDHHGDWALHHARWTHLANGFHSIEYWQVHPALAAIAPRMAHGYLLDALVGGSHIDWAMDPSTGRIGFDRFIERLHGRAATPDHVKALLQDRAAHARVDDLMRQIEQEFVGLAPSDGLRTWLFDLAHRQRFHVGWILWADSFGSWPATIALDRRLHRFMAGVPVAGFAERALQRALLVQKFPALAEVPLDRGSDDTTPLLLRIRHLAARHLKERFAARMEPIPHWRWYVKRVRQMLPGGRREPHHFVRQYDYNGAGWRQIRARTEPLDHSAGGLLHGAAVRDLLGPATATIGSGDHFSDRAERRLLHGFLLWRQAVSTRDGE